MEGLAFVMRQIQGVSKGQEIFNTYGPLSLGTTPGHGSQETPGKLVFTQHLNSISLNEFILLLFKTSHRASSWFITLQGTITYPLPFGTFESMIFVLPRWDMLVSSRVTIYNGNLRGPPQCHPAQEIRPY